MVHVIWLVNPLFYAMFKGLNPTKMTIELSKLNYSQNMATEARKCHFPVQVCEIRRKRLTKTLKSYSGDYKDSTQRQIVQIYQKRKLKFLSLLLHQLIQKKVLSKNSVSNLTWKGGGGGEKEGRGDSTTEMVRNRVVERLKILFNCRTNSPYRHRQMPKEVSEDARLL